MGTNKKPGSDHSLREFLERTVSDPVFLGHLNLVEPLQKELSVSFEEDLKLERYKLVTDRQKYFTELAKDTFNSYVRVFVTFTGGAVALIYFKKQLEVDPQVIIDLLKAIALLLSLVAVISIGQIFFCLVRWYGLRSTECKINPDCPKPECWAWIYEGLYMLAILGSIFLAWTGFDHFKSIVLRGVGQA